MVIRCRGLLSYLGGVEVVIMASHLPYGPPILEFMVINTAQVGVA
jgi:hypothetical protein